jgi:4a-hydroxytetrahydrobiopterin dehydratase
MTGGWPAAILPDMDEQEPGPARTLSRPAASAAVSGLGWRYLRGTVRTSVRAESPGQAAEIAARVIAAAGDDAGQCLRADIRGDRLILTLQSPATASVTSREVELAGRISQIVTGLGLATVPDAVSAQPRPVQILEIAIDALDIASVRPFWKAVLGYDDETGGGPADGLADPAGQNPTIWFQQMDAPRPERNRIHFDVSVPHDAAASRIEAAIAAGGTLKSDAEAPAFWLLADAEGNEACVCTWQGREE